MDSWTTCKNILCVRLDNMGDLLMSSPAIRALKETFGCKITLLASSSTHQLATCIPAVDDVLIFDAPWVKADQREQADDIVRWVEALKEYHFDGAVIFTVFSQNPLPAGLLLYLAGIPRTLAYCRENPYHLLTHWVPEQEPYNFIQHQVERDLALVRHVGASTRCDDLQVRMPDVSRTALYDKLLRSGFDIEKPFVIFHPGVSERKREFPVDRWIKIGKELLEQADVQIAITGNSQQQNLSGQIRDGIDRATFSLAGLLSLEEFMWLIKFSHLVITVNTFAGHWAAAVQTPVIVLYALTNPQHVPWKGHGAVFPFEVPVSMESKSEVLRYVHQRYRKPISLFSVEDVVNAAVKVLHGNGSIISPNTLIRDFEA